MRRLILLKGAHGVGKSTLVKAFKLEQYTLSADEFRILLQSPIMGLDGYFELSQAVNKKAWDILHEVLDKRMANGEFTVIDATHSKSSDIQKYKALADKYRYNVYIIDFTDVPERIAKERNMQSEIYKRVSNEEISKVYRRFRSEKSPSFTNTVHYTNANTIIKQSILDFSHYSKIHHIGDIHGCYTVLMDYLKGGLNENELYIFTGDYIDRGIENAKVLKFLFRIMSKPNVILLEGNHEIHLWNFGNFLKSSSFAFERETKPELEANSIDKKDIRRFCKKLKSFACYTYKGKTIFVTHGGMPKFPENIALIASQQLIRGVGDYLTNIDDIFTSNHIGSEIYQIHGHRNRVGLPIIASQNSFNLEGRVDAGGELRTLVLDKNGFHPIMTKNNIFKVLKK